MTTRTEGLGGLPFHSPATCPAFGGCNDCRSAKFEAASPDVDYQPLGGWEPEDDPRPVLEPWEPITFTDSADPVDYSAVPAFNAAADKSLARCQAVHAQRGNTYGDSWALQNVVTTFLDCALTAIYGDSDIPIDAKRLLESASIADVKESRLNNGSWKLDNVDDGINYRAAFATWREAYRRDNGV